MVKRQLEVIFHFRHDEIGKLLGGTVVHANDPVISTTYEASGEHGPRHLRRRHDTALHLVYDNVIF